MKGEKIAGPIRDVAPCKGCADRKRACSDSCEKFRLWKAEKERVNANRRKYELDRRAYYKGKDQ